MQTTADYLSAIVFALIGIAWFINLRNGTLGSWLKAKFLGVGGSPGTTSGTAKAAA